MAHGTVCSCLSNLAGNGAIHVIRNDDRLDDSLDRSEICRIRAGCDWRIGHERFAARAACVFGA